MLDLLDAPVPSLIGCTHIFTSDEQRYYEGVYFVSLDDNSITYEGRPLGVAANGSSSSPIPSSSSEFIVYTSSTSITIDSRLVSKLRGALDRYGRMDSRWKQSLETAGILLLLLILLLLVLPLPILILILILYRNALSK